MIESVRIFGQLTTVSMQLLEITGHDPFEECVIRPLNQMNGGRRIAAIIRAKYER